MYVSVDVEAVIFTGKHHTPVVHQSYVEALSVFHLALQSRDQLPVLGEDCQVEVVVVVRDGDLPCTVDADTDGIVGDAFASNLSQEISLVVENFDAVCSVVANEDLLPVVDDNTIRELQVFGATELVKNISHLIEDDNTHDLALNNDDSSFVVNTNAARMLKDVGAKLSNKLSVLVVDLNLMCWRPLGHNNVSAGLHHRHSVGVEQLAVPLAHLTELELEPALLVEDLDAVVVGVRHDDVILSVHRHTAGLCELALKDPELSKLAVIDHLLTFYLRLERVETRPDAGYGTVLDWSPWGQGRRAETGLGHELGGQVQDRVV